jgi:hypothetical protein
LLISTNAAPNITAEGLTAGVVAGSEEDASSGLAFPNDMAGSGSRENAVLADQELLDTVGGTDLCDQLDDLGVPVATITTNDEEGACVLSVSSGISTGGSAVRGRIKLTLSSLRYRQEDGGDKCLAVVWLLEDCDLLAKT